MNTRLSKVLLALFMPAILLISSCRDKDDDPIPVAQYGYLKMQFDYVFGANQLPWEIGKTMVHSKTGDTLTFTTFKYYVSNIKLKKADGTWWSQPESYHLLDAAVKDGSMITINDIPAGDYTAMEYTMGVDSARNVSGAQTGALSLTNAMFWDWNTGYIMLKAEGYSPNAANNGFAFHLGGFSGADNIVTVKSTDFGGTTLKIAKDKDSKIKFVANPARLWHTSPSVSTRATIHMPGAEAKVMANDFYSNISFVGLE